MNNYKYLLHGHFGNKFKELPSDIKYIGISVFFQLK